MNESTDPRPALERLAGVPVPEPLFARLLALTDLVLRENETHNLTAVRDRGEFLVKHIADSLRPLAALDLAGRRVADVGSGAGFPGLVLALAGAGEVHLVESVGKKAAFLSRAAAALGLRNVTVHAARAEELGRGKLRERFDLAVCRAFGPAGYCLEILLPLVRRGGAALLMEGAAPRLTPAVREAARTLGGGEIDEHPYQLEEYGNRCLALVAKARPTPPRFPRANAAMRRAPLDPGERAPAPDGGGR